jgi:hypothetical protein
MKENKNLKEVLKREFMKETNLDIEVGDIVDMRIEKTFCKVKIIVVFMYPASY